MIILDFEEQVAILENQIEELKKLSSASEEVITLQKKAQDLLKNIYSQLTPWQKVQVARHQSRPKFFDYRDQLFTDFIELSGDKNFFDDKAIVGGLAKLKGQSCMVIGIEKGNSTESRVYHNFGMPKPEGYRKAVRLMTLADRFHLPIITFIDTQGADPGIDAEARGQGEAIASATQKCLQVQVPIIAVIIGEGFSGGAIGIGTADHILMLEHSVFTVIGPEGCASILWKDASKKQEAAETLKLTAQDLIEYKIIDSIIKEPIGGAHRAPFEAIMATGDEIEKHLNMLIKNDPEKLQQDRFEKYLR